MKGKSAHAIPALGAVEAFKHALNVLEACHRVSEEHGSTRAAINARLQIELTKLQHDREIVLDYLKRTFEERRETFERLFQLADAAIKGRENQQLGKVLDAMVELARASPLAAALETVESTRAALADRSRAWEV